MSNLVDQIKSVLPQLISEMGGLSGEPLRLNKGVEGKYWQRLTELLGQKNPMFWGNDSSTGQPNLRRRHFYAVRWFKKQGYMDTKGSQLWLTPEGILYFQTGEIKSHIAIPDPNTETITVPKIPEDTVQNSVQVQQNPATTNPYFDDPYLIRLAMETTRCADGFFSKKSGTCSCCPVKVQCSANLVRYENDFASLLRQQEEDYFAALARAEHLKNNPEPEPQANKTVDYDFSNCEPVSMVYDAHCQICDTLVKQEENGYWVGDSTNMVCESCYEANKPT